MDNMAIVYRAKMVRPLMLPIQQTDFCIATQKRNIMNGYNRLALFFCCKKNWSVKQYYKNSMRISYHCWTESVVDLQEGQFIPQYYYFANSNKYVNKKDEEG